MECRYAAFDRPVNRKRCCKSNTNAPTVFVIPTPAVRGTKTFTLMELAGLVTLGKRPQDIVTTL